MSEKNRNKCHSNHFQWCPLSYPHPAMSKCLKRAETSVILIVFNGVLFHIHILQCQNVWKAGCGYDRGHHWKRLEWHLFLLFSDILTLQDVDVIEDTIDQWCHLLHPHPAMSKCLKGAETSVILIIFNDVIYHIHILQCQNVWKEQKQVSF
jgi:hypothetical protein